MRSGHTEAAIDLARLAGREPAGVICEIMREDGEMARLPDLERFAAEHGLGIVRIADLIQHRLSRELLVRRVRETAVRPRGPGLTAEYRAYVYATDVEETQYLALVLGELRPEVPDPGAGAERPRAARRVRPGRPRARPPRSWLRMIEEEGRGVFLYVVPRGGLDLGRRPGATPAARRIGPAEAAARPARRCATSAWAPRCWRTWACGNVRLLTNKPRRIAGLEGYGIHVVECVPSRPPGVVVPLREEKG